MIVPPQILRITRAQKHLVLTWLLGVALLTALTGEAQLTVTQIAAGANDSFFVQNGGNLWAVGYNNDGQLGNYSTNTIYFPAEIVGGGLYTVGSTPPSVTAIAAKYAHSFFVESDHSLWAMGDNSYGEFGNGSYENYDFPTEILTNQVTAVAAGGQHALLIKRHGLGLNQVTELWVMGNNAHGQLGTTNTISTILPEKILSTLFDQGAPVIAVAAGDAHSLFLKTDNSLWAMGNNGNGQLGDGTTSDSHVPEQVPTTGLVTKIAAALNHSLFIQSDGSLWAMGNNYEGDLGNGTSTDIHAPAMIVSSNVTTIAAGNHHTLFIKSDGSLWGMGDDNNGELDGMENGNVLVPKLIVAGGVTAAASGDFHSLFLTSDGGMWGMGDNTYGQLENYPTPVSPVQIVGPVVANGGFETGDFLGWAASNWLIGTNYVSSASRFAHSGVYGLRMPLPGATAGEISQTLPTTSGGNYLLSFWLNCDGLTPDEFTATWNGTNLLDLINPPNLGWTNIEFTVAATGSNTELQFGFTDSSGYFGLDDISAVQLTQPVITCISMAGANLVLNVANGLAGKTYFTLMSTNLTLQLTAWMPVATNVLNTTGNFNLTVTNGVAAQNPQRFFILKLANIIILEP
jgi:alpha-tubulin suppressor-like RCC1 family protein